jgi:hypothetical protein
VASLLQAVEETLRQSHIIRLSNRDRDLFLAALETEEKPKKELKKLLEDSSGALAERFTKLNLFIKPLSSVHGCRLFCGCGRRRDMMKKIISSIVLRNYMATTYICICQ